MDCTLQAGDRVVCINISGWRKRGYGDETLPVQGQTYTIREVFVIDGGVLVEGQGIIDLPMVRLVEIVNPVREYWPHGHDQPSMVVECGFAAHRFRPLVTTKTDISVFKKILADAGNERVRETAD